MSTRSVIAIPHGDGWKGRYHHSDGYPAGLGAFLATARDAYFGGDLAAMVDKLVTAEPVGWSFILGCDLTLDPAWYEYGDPRKTFDAGMAPQSYTARGESPHVDTFGDGTGWWITPDTDTDTEWCYVLTPGGILVFSHSYADQAWIGHGMIPWGDTLAMGAIA